MMQNIDKKENMRTSDGFLKAMYIKEGHRELCLGPLGRRAVLRYSLGRYRVDLLKNEKGVPPLVLAQWSYEKIGDARERFAAYRDWLARMNAEMRSALFRMQSVPEIAV